jgi:hypothetical protein
MSAPRSRHRLVPLVPVAGLLGVVLLLSSCAAGPNVEASPAGQAGFLRGLWHGFILLVTFVISLFTDNISIYEVNNTGNWYDFGFVLGAMIALGGAGSQTRKRG